MSEEDVKFEVINLLDGFMEDLDSLGANCTDPEIKKRLAAMASTVKKWQAPERWQACVN